MGNRFAQFEPDQVLVSFAGVPAGGFAAGEFITIEYDSDTFSDEAGTDGEVARSRSNDNRATVTVKLLQTSETNALFSALHNADKKSRNGAGVGAIAIADLSGTSLYTGSHAWILKAPNVNFDREIQPREWVIRVANLESFTGGN